MSQAPDRFEGVTVLTKANVFFEGGVVSHTLLFPGGKKKTLGLIRPGTYGFDTDIDMVETLYASLVVQMVRTLASAGGGEIVVRAPWLTRGYLKDQKSTEKLWSGGVLHTGDVAWRDPRGYVKITDRMKDVIKVGGEWLSSLEVEDVLAAHPGVAEVAVVGASDAKWGERPLALVVRKAGHAAVTERDLQHHAHGFVEKGILPKQVALLHVKFVEALEKTSVGKVNKLALRQKHL